MKVAFVINSPFRLGGAQRVTSIIANKLEKIGYDVTIISTKPVEVNLKLYGLSNNVNLINVKKRPIIFKIINLPCKLLRIINMKFNFLKKYKKILKYIYYTHDNYILKSLENIINSNKYNYVIGVEGIDFIPLTIIKNKIDSKIIGWQHSSTSAYYFTRGMFYFNQDELMKDNLKKLDYYITLTKKDGLELKNKYLIENKTIYNPVSFTTIEKANPNNKRFIAAGRLHTVKGFDIMIETYKIYKLNGGKWPLYIYGDGDEYSNLSKIIKKYNLESDVILGGYTIDIKKEMLNSSVYLMTSKLEGLPMVILEAMECGLPVITFDLSFCSEILINNSGYLITKNDIFSFANAMLKLSTNSVILSEMKNNAIMEAKKYDIENIIKQWEKILK
ncbi:MAG: glycosyltransferase [Bacilli bacterium]